MYRPRRNQVAPFCSYHPILARILADRLYDPGVRYRREIEVLADATRAFEYIADFSRAAEWDPGVAEARRLSDGPTELGSRFELIALFRGNRQRFEYVVTALEPGRRIALHGEGAKAVSDDTVAVATRDGHTVVTYEADLRLRGPYRIAEPFLGGMVERMGDHALDGLKAKLDAYS
jgi:carbon monoxide dehydrogenase subunit G